MRQVGLLRGPDEAGNVLILPIAARYAATYDKAGQETKKGQRNRQDGPKPQQLEILDVER